jgi:hypothetical protein
MKNSTEDEGLFASRRNVETRRKKERKKKKKKRKKEKEIWLDAGS